MERGLSGEIWKRKNNGQKETSGGEWADSGEIDSDRARERERSTDSRCLLLVRLPSRGSAGDRDSVNPRTRTQLTPPQNPATEGRSLATRTGCLSAGAVCTAGSAHSRPTEISEGSLLVELFFDSHKSYTVFARLSSSCQRYS